MPKTRRRHDKGPWFWRGAIGAMSVSVVGLFALAAFRVEPATGEDGCRIDRKDPAHTIVLIDQSDPFVEADLAWVEDLVDAEARDLPRFGRLTLMVPDADEPFGPDLVFSQCSPGSPADSNPLFENPRMIEDAWQADFFRPLKAEMDRVLSDQVAPASPLMEALYAVADRSDFRPGQKHRRIVIVSDLMQHSEGFSLYRSGADGDAFAATDLSAQVPDLGGVAVVARIVPRQSYDLPLAEIRAFWSDWFDASGALYGSVN